jgi:hypothetical protein
MFITPTMAKRKVSSPVMLVMIYRCFLVLAMMLRQQLTQAIVKQGGFSPRPYHATTCKETGLEKPAHLNTVTSDEIMER